MKKLLPWLTSFVILVVVFGSIYAVTQQSQRSDANYPQIQIAEDTAAALNHGSKPESQVGEQVYLSASLAPFVIIYNKSGQAIAGSGQLAGHIPHVPLGVLTASNGKTYNAVTWQPNTNERIASVAVAANNYYVFSGRSLKEVEKNESNTFLLSAAGLAVSIIVLCTGFLLAKRT